MKKISILFIFIITYLFMHCSPNEISFSGDENFDKIYLKPFIKSAEFYGIPINKYPLAVVYVEKLYDPKKPGKEVAGLSVLDELTIYFNVNHEYWKNENSRIVLVYHELGHYLLSKMHVDEYQSCDIPFSIMSLWSESASPQQFEYWTSGDWHAMEDYYMEEIFRGSNVWKNYPPKPNLIYHERISPCWN